ncbi:DUF6171 family protein [Roseburia hominis]
MQEGQRYCRKCLLREMDEAEYFKNMYDYIARLPHEDKVSDEEYERRLSICKGCDYLLQGMCRLCGCYVEMRAVMKVRGCPDIPDRWKA